MKAVNATLEHSLLVRPITREEALSLRGALNASLRDSHGGGRPRTCDCGTCAVCKRRAKRRTKS